MARKADPAVVARRQMLSIIKALHKFREHLDELVELAADPRAIEKLKADAVELSRISDEMGEGTLRVQSYLDALDKAQTPDARRMAIDNAAVALPLLADRLTSWRGWAPTSRVHPTISRWHRLRSRHLPCVLSRSDCRVST